MTTQIEMTHDIQVSHSPLRKLLWVSPLSMIAATAANLILYAAAGTLFPEVTAWPGAGLGQIIGANIVYLLMGTIVFALVARFSSRPARHYFIVATIGLLLSLALPISAAFGYGAPSMPLPGTATVITLSLMHIVTYAISVPMFIHLVLQQK